MARTTYITYEEKKGFWIDEPRLEIISAFVVQAFKQKGLKNKPEWYMELFEDFDDIMKGHVQNMAHVLFEDYLEMQTERESEIISVLELSKTLIAVEGEKLSAGKMNKMQAVKDWGEYTKVEWIGSLYTEDMIQVIDIMIKMLKHEWVDGQFEMKFR